MRQIEALNAHTGPVLLAYRDAPAVDAMLKRLSLRTPDADATADDGVRHTLWSVRDAAAQRDLTKAFAAMPALYIADGHHRSAAAARVAAARRAANARHTGNESYNYFLAVLFPQRQTRILDYNRVVADLNGMDRASFLAQLATKFSIAKSRAKARPSKPSEFGLYLPGQWYQLALHSELIPANDPVGRLDANLLAKHVLGPLLGITDLRGDKRIDYVGGVRGMDELERRVSDGMAAAFALHPVSMDDLMANTGFPLIVPDKVKTTLPPTKEQLKCIREVIDPERWYTG